MLRLLTNTYLFRTAEVNSLLSELFYRYMNTLDYINLRLEQGSREYIKLFEKAETARSMLFFLGYYYPEVFATGAIERRLSDYDITPLRFYEVIDREGHFDLSYLEPDQAEIFRGIVEFYKLIKIWKNLTVPGYKLYFAEDYLNDTKKRLIKLIEQDLGQRITPNEWHWIMNVK